MLAVWGFFACASFGATDALTQEPPPLQYRFYISPAEIRTRDTRVIAEQLVGRLNFKCSFAGAIESEDSIGEAADVIMMVPQEAFASIARYGFLNQHVTRETRGLNKTQARFRTEQELAMLRLPYSFKGRELLPKYALLNIKRPGFGHFPIPERYGSAAVVFKKDVLRRMTWTYADSLDLSQLVGRYRSVGASNLLLPRTARYQRTASDFNTCGNYCEAQIWGALSLEDVAYVMIRGTEPVHADVLDAGVPIYRFSAPSSTIEGMTVQFVRGARVTKSVIPSAPPSMRFDDEMKLVAEPVDSLISRLAVIGPGSSEGMMSDRVRLIGELGSRPKDAKVVRVLVDALGSKDEWERSIALHGLSELPSERFTPLLLKALRDAHPVVQETAIALADPRLDDAEVRASIRDLRRRSSDGRVQEWLERLNRMTLCD